MQFIFELILYTFSSEVKLNEICYLLRGCKYLFEAIETSLWVDEFPFDKIIIDRMSDGHYLSADPLKIGHEEMQQDWSNDFSKIFKDALFQQRHWME